MATKNAARIVDDFVNFSSVKVCQRDHQIMHCKGGVQIPVDVRAGDQFVQVDVWNVGTGYLLLKGSKGGWIIQKQLCLMLGANFSPARRWKTLGDAKREVEGWVMDFGTNDRIPF